KNREKELKEEKLTVSGVPRSEQRKKYFERKKSVLTKKDKAFIEIPLEKFPVDASKQLLREIKKDQKVLRALLSEYIG
ncbi:MAG: hypothetical protein MK066_13395, partial [Crocinitomicaceae bacterium]|nr:hypothetical protein [Crocinitomicaceae bacterium]